ncbi:MAG: single-stranded-DNA-specific exonuclease RecJ [bacterium]
MTKWRPKNNNTEATDIEIRGKTIPRVIVQILKTRGYLTTKSIEKFFAPALSDLHDPFLMDDMEKAVDRIIRAIKNKEKVLIHGDYDTDGITGVALLVKNLEKFGLGVSNYIPRRLEEGYGLQKSGIARALEEKCSLIITVDCGSSAIDEIADAKKEGIDVIVCDHHRPKAVLPDALALINPKVPGSNYPFPDLAGVGVAFKLTQALHEKIHRPKEECNEDLDLVALGSVVDIVPLIDENRTLVKYGISKIPKSQKTGIKALLEETGLKRGVTAYHLGFIIGPRINACGRLRDARSALELFLTRDMPHALQLARSLSLDNQERKGIEDRIYDEAVSIIKATGCDKDRIIVLAREGWHEGVLGIVASRITSDYYSPSLLLSLKEGVAKGSARSIPGVDITQAIGNCQELLIKYGGHTQAAGLELNEKNLESFRTCLNAYAQGIDSSIFERQSLYDTELDLADITPELIYFLKYFEPTGMANPQPVFYGKDFEVVGIPRVVGSNHLKIALRKGGKVFAAIAFDQADDILGIEIGKTRVNCLYSIAEDAFLGKRKVVLRIKEMEKTEP